MSCTCVVCARHGEVHEQVRVDSWGGAVLVDRELVDLVTATKQAGMIPVASCIDLAEAVRAMAPEWMPRLTAPGQAVPNYERVLTKRLAFVRVLPGGCEAADAMAETAHQSGGQVLKSGPVLQVAFPHLAVSRMLRCLS